MNLLIKYCLTSVLICLVLSGCDEGFEELNTNPNAPTKVAPGLLLPNIIRTTSNTLVNHAYAVGNLVVQYSTHTGANANDRYVWDSFSGLWNGLYGTLKDVNNLESLAIEANHENYQAIALILKSYLFSVLTDAYGDIPYFEVGKAKSEGIYQLTYDSQADIYPALIADLELANSKLGAGNGQIDGDILFQGQYIKWQKFANSLRIRLHMRMEKTSPSTIGDKISQIINNPSEFPVFESNADNAALQYLPDFPNQWPMFTLRPADVKELKLSATLAERLKGLNDPRLPVYAAPTQSSAQSGTPEYVGVPNALTEGTGAQYNGGSAFQSELGRNFYYEANKVSGVFIHYAELMFLLAEASHKGIISGDAQAYYAKGIQGSFAQYGIPVGSYLEQPAVVFQPAEGLRQIATQKWLSLFYAGLEAWFDWRRTGLPEIVPGPANVNNGKVPVRFLYPTLEQSLNSANYLQAVGRQGADDINTRMWIIQ